MKKLLTLLFTAAIVFSLTMPVFAQDTSSHDAPKAGKKTHAAKAAKTKKANSETKLKKT